MHFVGKGKEKKRRGKKRATSVLRTGTGFRSSTHARPIRARIKRREESKEGVRKAGGTKSEMEGLGGGGKALTSSADRD